MQKVVTHIALFFLWLISLLPFRVLYLLSDLLYHTVRLIGYRRDVINANLAYSFPEKSKEELREIRKKFYSHFCDLFIETIKIQTISKKEMTKRVHITNFEYLNEKFKEDKDVICVMGHYCNWEWIPSFAINSSALGCNVYRPLKNKVFDNYMQKLRSRWGNVNFTMRNTLKDIINLRKQNQRYVIGLIADQSPGKKEIQYWTKFLNQNTAIILGPEKIAKMTKSPIVYIQMDKVKRGYYEITIIPISETPETTNEFEITEKHVRLLEASIIKKPEFWLWSHKRWKYSKDRKWEATPINTKNE